MAELWLTCPPACAEAFQMTLFTIRPVLAGTLDAPVCYICGSIIHCDYCV